jgi:4-amino-4-deoxy-L-arabinose transferase-like glycosyltransferase
MPARVSVLPSTRVDPRVGPRSPAGLRHSGEGLSLRGLVARIGISRWGAAAWGTIGLTVTFIAITCWWLTVDRSVPVYDAGSHLEEAFIFHNFIQAGKLLEPFTYKDVYPPLGHLIGAFATFIGGVNVSAPIIGENLVFVPLLTLGCYQTGRLLFGPAAGLLAAIFVLGSPLLMAQLHVFMLDAPETALVAVSMWLILASEDFSRARVAGFAGLAVGAGLLIKLQFPFFVVGIVLVALARGGWRNWRGFAWFALIALVIGSPWYIDHLSEFSRVAQIAGADPGAAPGSVPPVLSLESLDWYFWSTLNSQLLAPLFALTLGGTVWLVVALVRGQEPRALRLEFLMGGLIAWFGITMVRHHDIRYDMPLMPYLAVIGSGWIIFLPRIWRIVASSVLVLAVVANTLGSTFGLEGKTELALASSLPNIQALPDRVVFYTSEGFLVAGPQRDGDVPGLLSAMTHDGVRAITWNTINTIEGDFSNEGVSALAFIAHLQIFGSANELVSQPAAADLIYQKTVTAGPAPCTRLTDGAGIWVARDNPASGKVTYYCPFPQPHYYGKSLLKA